MSRLIHQPDPRVLRRLQSDYRARRHAGVGGQCPPSASRLGGRQHTDPRCFEVAYLTCCKTLVSTAANGVAAATAVTIQVQPENSNYFKPCAIGIEVVDSADPSLRTTVRWHDFSIQDCPGLGVRNKAPVVGDTDYLRTGMFDPLNRDGCACPFNPGTFSNLANSFPGEATFFNDNPGAVDIVVTFWGDAKQNAPDCGCGYDRHQMPDPWMTYGGKPGGSAR